jgi:hypothetical protein
MIQRFSKGHSDLHLGSCYKILHCPFISLSEKQNWWATQKETELIVT